MVDVNGGRWDAPMTMWALMRMSMVQMLTPLMTRRWREMSGSVGLTPLGLSVSSRNESMGVSHTLNKNHNSRPDVKPLFRIA
jgi:hypothetical protein